MQGWASRLNRSISESTSAMRTPELASPSVLILSSMIRRTTRSGSSSPVPAAFERIRRRCSSLNWAASIAVSARLPMPVLIPYTSRFSSTARSTTACAVRTASQAAGSRAIRDPGSDSRRVSAIVSRPGRSTNVWSLMSRAIPFRCPFGRISTLPVACTEPNTDAASRGTAATPRFRSRAGPIGSAPYRNGVSLGCRVTLCRPHLDGAASVRNPLQRTESRYPAGDVEEPINRIGARLTGHDAPSSVRCCTGGWEEMILCHACRRFEFRCAGTGRRQVR